MYTLSEKSSKYKIVEKFTGHSVWWTKMIHQTERKSLFFLIFHRLVFCIQDFNCFQM